MIVAAVAAFAAGVLLMPSVGATEDDGYEVSVEQSTGYLVPMTETWVPEVTLTYPCPPGTLPSFDYYTAEVSGTASDDRIRVIQPGPERIGAPPPEACASPGYRHTHTTSVSFHAWTSMPAFSVHSVSVDVMFYGWRDGQSKPIAQYGPYEDRIDVPIGVFIDIDVHASGNVQPLQPGSVKRQEVTIRNVGNGEVIVMLRPDEVAEGMIVTDLEKERRPLGAFGGDTASTTTYSFNVRLPEGRTPPEPETVPLRMAVDVSAADPRSDAHAVITHDIDYWVGDPRAHATPSVGSVMAILAILGALLPPAWRP